MSTNESSVAPKAGGAPSSPCASPNSRAAREIGNGALRKSAKKRHRFVAAIDGLWGRQRWDTLCFLAKPAAVPARAPNPSAAAMNAITKDMLNWIKRAWPH